MTKKGVAAAGCGLYYKCDLFCLVSSTVKAKNGVNKQVDFKRIGEKKPVAYLLKFLLMMLCLLSN